MPSSVQIYICMQRNDLRVSVREKHREFLFRMGNLIRSVCPSDGITTAGLRQIRVLGSITNVRVVTERVRRVRNKERIPVASLFMGGS